VKRIEEAQEVVFEDYGELQIFKARQEAAGFNRQSKM